MSALRDYIRKLLNTEALEYYIDLTNMRELVPYIAEVISRNFLDLKELGEQLGFSELGLLPVEHSYGLVLFAVPDILFIRGILNLCPSAPPTWEELSSIYRHYVSSKRRLFPLIDVASLIPIIPFSTIAINDIRHSAAERLRRIYQTDLTPDIETAEIIPRLLEKYPAVIIEDLGIFPLIEPYAKHIEGMSDLLELSPDFEIYEELNTKSPDELYEKIMNRLEDLREKIINDVTDKIVKIIESGRPILDRARQLYSIEPYNMISINLVEKEPVIYYNLTARPEERILKHVDVILELARNRRPSIIFDISKEPYIYPTIVFYPEKLGEKGRKTAQLIATALTLRNMWILRRLQSLLDEVGNIIIEIPDEEYINPAEPYKGNEYIVITCGKEISPTSPVDYEYGKERKYFNNIEEFYNWFRKLAKEQVKRRNGERINITDMRNIMLITI